MAYWLIKSPFRTRSWAKVLATGEYQLYGIRNAQARNNIAQMQPGDEAVFYFQQTIWGVMQVATGPTPDQTSAQESRPAGSWLSITFTPSQTLESPTTLTDIKASSTFQNSSLLQQPRLSVVSITAEQWQELVQI